jgi:hypothetical protein
VSDRRKPYRPASSVTPDPNDELLEAEQEVAQARADREAVRRRVSAGEEGAAVLHLLDYRLHNGLEKLNRLRLYSSSPEPEPPTYTPPDTRALERRFTRRRTYDAEGTR